MIDCKYIFLGIWLALLLPACQSEEPTQKLVVTDMPKSDKRGVAFDFTIDSDLPLLSPFISWDYNWANVPQNDLAPIWFDANEMEFCPMCWNNNYRADDIRTYVADHPSTQYLLAYNEPNLKDQARMTPTQAVEHWSEIVALAKELNLKLVSPAMNYGTLEGYEDPIKWLDEFFAQPNVSMDDIDAISVHCYMPSASALLSYLERFEKYNKPIWLTEFCAWDNFTGDADAQMSYMCTALNALEKSDIVERYAWFIPRYKTDGTAPYMQLISSYTNRLTDAGKVYCYFSSMDKNAYLLTNRFIHAGEYSDVSSIGTQVRPTTDEYATLQAGKEGLMVTSMMMNQTLTYHVSLPKEASQIVLRYASFTRCTVDFKVDGKLSGTMDIQRTGGLTVWDSAPCSISIAAGTHEIEIILTDGSMQFSGFEINYLE